MRIEDQIETITTFEFKVFGGDKTHKDYLYDATPEQCCNYVWKNYYSSAHFVKMTEFGIRDCYIKHIERAELKAIVNVHANGHDDDMNIKSLQIQADKIKSFKNE